MAIPTPKVPAKRSWSIDTTPTISQKKSASVFKNKQTNKWSPSKVVSKPLVKKPLPTPPSRELFHQEKNTRSKSTSMSSILSTIISLLIIGVVGFWLWTNRASIINYLESLGLRWDNTLQQVDPNALFVGKEVSLTGTLLPWWKQWYYTQTLQNSIYTKLWLRSTSINFKDFTWEVQLGGQVVDFVDGTYVIDVTSIQSLIMPMVETGKYIDGIQYIPQAGLIIGDMKSDGLLLNEWWSANPNIIIITNTITNTDLVIRYFSCDESVAQNCKRFSESFNKSVGIDFVDSFGNVFYKLADGNTWFVSLDNRIGMYIETKEASMVPLVIKNIQFVTDSWAKKTFESKALSICISQDLSLRSTDSIRLVPHDGDVAVEVVGNTNTAKKATCLIGLDPNNSLAGKLITLQELDKEEDTTDADIDSVIEDVNPETSIPTSATTPLSTNGVKQFALKPGKEVKFTTRGNTIIFPSPSISYNSYTPSEAIAWLKCSIATRVINYANKANLTTSPDIILYGCASGTPKLDNTMTSFDAKGMTYIVKVNNPAWVDFANNIKVE